MLDGLWKPEPLPDDLFERINFPNDVGWMIASGKNTGSQLHTDPNLMGAWNLLLTGRKWWVIIPAQLNARQFSCEESCSPSQADHSNAWTWFQHVLPQIKDRRLKGYFSGEMETNYF